MEGRSPVATEECGNSLRTTFRGSGSGTVELSRFLFKACAILSSARYGRHQTSYMTSGVLRRPLWRHIPYHIPSILAHTGKQSTKLFGGRSGNISMVTGVM